MTTTLERVSLHESRHAAACLMTGVPVSSAHVDANGTGHVDMELRGASRDRMRRAAQAIVLGGIGDYANWPPAFPRESGETRDERQLALIAKALNAGQKDWDLIVADAWELAAREDFCQLESVVAGLLESKGSLNWGELRLAHHRVLTDAAEARMKAAEPRCKAFDATTTADGATGEFTAIVSTFGGIDRVGDRVLPGAYDKTLARWRASGDPVPVIYSHKWDDPNAHIGVADAHDIEPTPRGLLVKGRLDIDENPLARQVHRLMLRRSVKEFSIGYAVPLGGERRRNGVNEISEIDLVEVGPTLKGIDPKTELHAVKAQQHPATREAREALRAALGVEPGLVRDPLRRRRGDELRRRSDRAALEVASGIPWGMPGPTVPKDRAHATSVENDDGSFYLDAPRPHRDWPRDGLPDEAAWREQVRGVLAGV